jgi:chitinase
MIWAIDQDDTKLTALRAITDSSLASDDSAPFTLVDLHRIFPPEDYPTDDTDPRYGLVNFGSEADMGETDPDKTGFGFFLVAGESHAVSKLKRSAGDPEPFTFLDCPANAMNQPDDQVQIARVVCLNEDAAGCFRVMERGVEGTVVEMPDNCAPGTFARAVSLNASDDQSIPSQFEGRATSAVFDFAFDYNFKLIRRDSDQTSIRLDYSSIPGYWNSLVDSDGDDSTDARRLRERYYSRDDIAWSEKFNQLSLDERHTINVDKSLTQAMYWDSIDSCDVNGEKFGEGLGAYIDGSISASFEFGWSLYVSTTM